MISWVKQRVCGNLLAVNTKGRLPDAEQSHLKAATVKGLRPSVVMHAFNFNTLMVEPGGLPCV